MTSIISALSLYLTNKMYIQENTPLYLIQAFQFISWDLVNSFIDKDAT